MNIAIIGTGNVGAALGKRWAGLGHTIIFGSRDPQGAKTQALLREAGANARAASQAAACAAAEVILLAAPFHACEALLQELGSLDGKILIDATNPFGEGMRLLTWPNSSAAEQIAGWSGGARVVKAFNMTGSANMLDADYGALKPAMLVCGDDAAAKTLACELAGQIGFDPVDCGALSQAYLLETAAGLWVNLAYLQGQGPNIALTLLRRQ